jgi:hypothetical protein
MHALETCWLLPLKPRTVNAETPTASLPAAMQLQSLRRIGQWTKPPMEAHNSHHPRNGLPSADELEARLPGREVAAGRCNSVSWELRFWLWVASCHQAAALGWLWTMVLCLANFGNTPPDYSHQVLENWPTNKIVAAVIAAVELSGATRGALPEGQPGLRHRHSSTAPCAGHALEFPPIHSAACAAPPLNRFR